MKIFYLSLCFFVLFSAFNAQAQPNVDALKKENLKLKSQVAKLKDDTAYLRQVVITCNLLSKSGEFSVTNTNKNYKFEVLGCYGNRDAQTVSIDFMISTNLPHQLFQLHSGSGAPTCYDNIGNIYSCKSAALPNADDRLGTIDVTVPTNIRVKASITFRNVMPSTELLTLARFDYYSTNKDGGVPGTGDVNKVEIKDIKVQWE